MWKMAVLVVECYLPGIALGCNLVICIKKTFFSTKKRIPAQFLCC